MKELSTDAALIIGNLMVVIDKYHAEKTTEKLLKVCKNFYNKCENDLKTNNSKEAKETLKDCREAVNYVEDAFNNNVTYKEIYKKVHEYYSSETFELVR